MRSLFGRGTRAHAQSKASNKMFSLLRLGTGRTPHVPKLEVKAQLLRAEPAGADAPQIDRQLACDGNDGFFARRTGSERATPQHLFPFEDRLVIRLEAPESPGQLHQRRPQTRITVVGHATLQSRVAATVLSRT